MFSRIGGWSKRHYHSTVKPSHYSTERLKGTISPSSMQLKEFMSCALHASVCVIMKNAVSYLRASAHVHKNITPRVFANLRSFIKK